jgi:hypothetical protein
MRYRLIFAGFLTVAVALLAVFSHQQSTRLREEPGKAPQTHESTQVRRSVSLPYPHATTPDEVLANVVAYAKQTHLAETTQMPQLLNKNHELRVHRLLDVKSLWRREDYYLLELDDTSGRPLANAAIERDGALIGVEDLRPATDLSRPVDLSGAVALARRFTREPVKSVRYVYAPNYAEPGGSPFRPLAAVETADGVLYVNSRGEGFAESGSGLLARANAAPLPDAVYADGTMRLRTITPK